MPVEQDATDLVTGMECGKGEQADTAGVRRGNTETKRMKTKIKQLINRILGMKLVYRMILIYVIGGLLPLSAIIGYLIHGTNQVLVKSGGECGDRGTADDRKTDPGIGEYDDHGLFVLLFR